MIILTNEKLNTNLVLQKNNVIDNYSILKKSDINENQLFLLHKVLVNFNEEFSDLVDDLYTVAYNCEPFKNDILVLNKLSIEKYIDSILSVLTNNKYNFKCYKSFYIEQYLENNPEIIDIFKQNKDILIEIFKSDLNDSAHSASHILSVINILDIKDKCLIEKLSHLVKASIKDNLLYTKETLISLIELSKSLVGIDLKLLENKLDLVLEEEKYELPF